MADAGGFALELEGEPFVIDDPYLDGYASKVHMREGGQEMTFYGFRRPLETYSRALEQSGFLIEAIRESKPACGDTNIPADLARYERFPMFLFLRAVRP